MTMGRLGRKAHEAGLMRNKLRKAVRAVLDSPEPCDRDDDCAKLGCMCACHFSWANKCGWVVLEPEAEALAP